VVNAYLPSARYIQNRNALIELLEKKSEVLLQLPIDGQVRVAVKDARLSESHTDLGLGNLTLILEKTSDNIYPTETANNKSLIAKATENIMLSIQNVFSDAYSISEGVLSYLAAKAKVNDALDVFEEVSTGISTLAEETNDVTAQILDFRQNINTILTSPQELATSITGLFNALYGIARNPFAQIDLLAGFFNFGSDDAEIFITTPQRQQRKDNNDLLNNLILTDSLTLTNEAVLFLEFTNTTEIDNVRAIINTQNDTIIDRESLSEQVRDDLINQNKEVNKYLDQQELITPRVKEIVIKSQPLLTLAYAYDGNIDRYETLITLNSNPNINFMEGTVKILTK
jgi:prophage DNA circulation protein